MSIFNVYRTKKDVTDILSGDVEVGDRIEFIFGKFGLQSATACVKEDNMELFMFDNVIGQCKAKEAKHWLNDISKEFPSSFGDVQVLLPTCGMIFGEETVFRYFYEDDMDKQFIFMNKRVNRDCDYNGKPTGWILSNKSVRDKDLIPIVSKFGNAGHTTKNKICGIRPIFWIELRKEGQYV